MAGDEFTLDFDLTSQCVRCQAERDLDGLEGELIASGETTQVIKATTPCACGETRVKVTFDIG